MDVKLNNYDSELVGEKFVIPPLLHIILSRKDISLVTNLCLGNKAANI